MKTLSVLINFIIAVSFLNVLINATGLYWLNGGNTCQNGQAELCRFIDFKSVLCCACILDNGIEVCYNNFPPLDFYPPKSIGFYPWDLIGGYWNPDQLNYDYWNYNLNLGDSPESFQNFDGPNYDLTKEILQLPPPYNNGDKFYDDQKTNIDNLSDIPIEDGIPPPPDGLDPSNRGGGGDGPNDGRFVSQITNSTEGLNIQEPFYRPTIQNSTSLRKCSEYFKPNQGPSTFFVAVVGGVDARPKEFPHVALLGYGDPDDIAWLCGGSLISEEFVLTAAHCIFSRQGMVKYVRLGELDLNSTKDDSNVTDFTVAETITHPQYDFFSGYHDIALIRLNTSIKSFNGYVKPACLATTKNVEDTNLRIAGWGVIENNGPRATILQTASLKHVAHARCRKAYGRSAKLKQGIIEDIHICADGGMERKDACNGDSGGPLQFTNNDYADQGIPSFVELAGVTSLGFRCGLVPGVYTRVLPYVQWIESKVWPQ